MNVVLSDWPVTSVDIKFAGVITYPSAAGHPVGKWHFLWPPGTEYLQLRDLALPRSGLVTNFIFWKVTSRLLASVSSFKWEGRTWPFLFSTPILKCLWEVKYKLSISCPKCLQSRAAEFRFLALGILVCVKWDILGLGPRSQHEIH